MCSQGRIFRLTHFAIMTNGCVQYNLVERRRILIPTPLWAAAVHTISLSSDLWRVTEQAYNRGLVAYEFELLSREEMEGVEWADDRYAKLLAARSGSEELAPLREGAERGDSISRIVLDEILGFLGVSDALAELRQRAFSGDDHATDKLVDVLAERDDDAALSELRQGAGFGNDLAGEQLIMLLAKRGDEGSIAEIRSRARFGNSSARWKLADLLAQLADQQSISELRELLDGEREDPSIHGKLLAALGRCADDDSIAELQFLADAGDVDAEAHLLGALIRRGVEGRLRTSLEDQIKERHPFKYVQIGIEAEGPDAMMVLRAYATADPESAGQLMDILARRGDDAAISELRLWADVGVYPAAEVLARVLAASGDEDALRSEVWAGNSRHAAKALFRIYAAGNPDQYFDLLNRTGLQVDASVQVPEEQ